MSAPALQWQTPEPLWARFGPDGPSAASRDDQQRPAILRFASDDFMDQALATLSQDPKALDGYLARPETWRSPYPSSSAPTGAADGSDYLGRLPLPGLMRRAARGLALGGRGTRVAPVDDSRTQLERSRTRQLPLKLFHPAHQRYYLLSASLVCGQLGMPDRRVNSSTAERVGYVLRRLVPVDANDPDGPSREYAFVAGPDGARWQRVSADGNDAALSPGEEMLPLFPLVFDDARGHGRTLWSGLIPVGRREQYMATGLVDQVTTLGAAQQQAFAGTQAQPTEDSRRAVLAVFQTEIVEPWKALIREVFRTQAAMAETVAEDDETDTERLDRVRDLNLQWQMQSWLLLLDMAEFLKVHLPDLWQRISVGQAPAPGTEDRVLYDWLGDADNAISLTGAIGTAPRKSPSAHLRSALAAVGADGIAANLEAVEGLYTDHNKTDPLWPGFHFLLAGLIPDGSSGIDRTPPTAAGAFRVLNLLPATGNDPLLDGLYDHRASVAGDPVQVHLDRLDRVTAQIARCLPAPTATQSNEPAPPLPFALQVRDALAANGSGSGWFVARCVHLSTDCGPLSEPTLSASTQRFQLASFFDPDAPARPVRITLPTDTTPAGLRRHSRGTAFVISDVLCGQIQRAKGLGFVDLVRSVLPWPLHKDLDLGDGGKCGGGSGVDIGMICSLSIPIITICALILLIIMVTLLDIIFRWLPYLIFCFPVPGLRGKGGSS
jgi:hypothetical protein